VKDFMGPSITPISSGKSPGIVYISYKSNNIETYVKLHTRTDEFVSLLF
jgi:hypothetical protein